MIFAKSTEESSTADIDRPEGERSRVSRGQSLVKIFWSRQLFT